MQKEHFISAAIGYVLLGALLIPHPGIIVEPDGQVNFAAGLQGNMQFADPKNAPNEGMHVGFLDLRYGFGREENKTLVTAGYRYEIPIIAATKSADGSYQHFRGIRPKNLLSFYPSIGMTFSGQQFLYLGGLLKYANPNMSYYIEVGKRYNLNATNWADWSGLIGFSILM